MATKKVRKFGRGGDILTGLGAGLLGYAAYKALNKDKDKDDDYTSKVKEFGRKGRYPEEKTEEKADAKKAEAKVAADKDEEREAKQKRAIDQSKNPRLNLVPEGADKDVLYESDKALVRTDGKGTKPIGGANKPKPRLAPKAQVDKSADKSVNKNFSSFAPTSKNVTTSLNDRNAVTLEKGTGTKDKSASKITQLSPDSDAAKAMRQSRAQRLGTTYSRMYTQLQDKSLPEGPGKEALKGAVDKARKDYEDASSGMKKGGAVKKMASGGMARSSASKRADGCAIRGKTRA